MGYKMWFKDVARFMVIYVVALLGFALVFFTMEESVEASEAATFALFGELCLELFTLTMGEITLGEFVTRKDDTLGGLYQTLSMFLLLVYITLTTIMMFNLLIAMMGDTYAQIKEESLAIYLQLNAQVVIEMESSMSTSEWDKIKAEKWWIDVQGERYTQSIHTDFEHGEDHWKDDVSKSLAQLDKILTQKFH